MTSFKGYDIGKQDTYAILQRKQVDDRDEKRRQERRDAHQVLEEYGKRHDWSQEDVEVVVAALGLDQDA